MKRTLVVVLCLTACSAKKSKDAPTESAPEQPEPAKVTPAAAGPIDVDAIWDRYVAAANARDVDALKELYADDATVTPASSGMTVTGPDQIAQFFAGFGDAFPDLKSEEILRLVNGATIASVSRTRGTNTGAMMGMPATNKPTSFIGLSIAEIDSAGAIKRHTLYADNLSFMAQLGAWQGPHRGYDDGAAPEARRAERSGSKAEADNVRLVGAMVDAYNSADVAALAGFYAEDAVLSDQSAPADVTGDAIAADYAAWFAAFPDAKKRDLAMWSAGDWVVSTYALTGTNKGPYPRLGVKSATGKPIRVESADVVRIQNGKVAEQFTFADGMALAIPLGSMGPPVAP